jgi:gamma-glutamylaminecyclotransferase
MIEVFVYGTLKRGGSNHHFLAGQHFLAEARTPPGFTLFLIGDYPGMVRDPHDAEGVTGELWSVTHDCLQRLDDLEGVDEKLYERVTISLTTPLSSCSAQTYLYLRSVAGRPHLGAAFPV